MSQCFFDVCVSDLTQIESINRRDDLSIYPSGTRPNGDGMELNPFLYDGLLIFQVNVLVEEQIASPPWGIAKHTRA